MSLLAKLLAFLTSLVQGPVAVPIAQVAERSPRPTRALPALEPEQAPPSEVRPAEHVRICVDFGTSQSTVARAIHGAMPDLAVLQVDPRTGRRWPTIDSDIVYSSEDRAVLGAAARLLEERGRRPNTQYFRSLKRMLSDLSRVPDSHLMLRLRVEALVEELLRLALDPSSSGTLRKQAELMNVNVADLAAHAGLPNRAGLADTVARGVLDLYLCVPNAFGNFEEEVLRDAAYHAGVAFQRSLAADRPPIWNAEDARATVVVHLVREAEAVAWWVLHQKQLPPGAGDQARMLVFDVGAGSTDAAIVTVRSGEGAGESPTVHTEAHSGASFGGHDVDELLLRLMADRSGSATLDQIGQKISKAGTTRARELRQFADAKEAWAREVNDAFTRDPELLDAFVTWVDAAEGSVPGEQILPAIRPQSDAWPDVRELTAAHWGVPYARFLRGVVTGVLRALDAAEPGTAIDRVVLSGRGTLLPGVRALVTRRLVASGRIRSAEQVVAVDADEERLKLACVLGIAAAAASASVPERLPQMLAEEVSIGRNVPLWTRGVRIQDCVVRAAVRLEGKEGARRVGFYQYRVPREVAAAIGASTLWEQRHLGAAEIFVFDAVEVAVVFDVGTGALGVWRLVADGPPVPIRLEVDPVFASAENPISRLPFGWVDA